MAIGSYGTIRPSDVSPEDVQIIMNYTPSRDVTDNFILTELDAQTLLKPYFNNTQTGGNAGVEILGGLYNLTLPAEQFNALGIYTLYLRPAQIRTVITDCGVLSALPNVKGIIIDISNVPVQYQNKFVQISTSAHVRAHTHADTHPNTHTRPRAPRAVAVSHTQGPVRRLCRALPRPLQRRAARSACGPRSHRRGTARRRRAGGAACLWCRRCWFVVCGRGRGVPDDGRTRRAVVVVVFCFFVVVTTYAAGAAAGGAAGAGGKAANR